MISFETRHSSLGHVMHPFCSDLSTIEKIGFFIASCFAGLFSLGGLHAYHYYHHHGASLFGRATYKKEDLNEALALCYDTLRDEVAEFKGEQGYAADEFNSLTKLIDKEFKSVKNDMIQAFNLKENPYANSAIVNSYDRLIKLTFLLGVASLRNLDTYISQKGLKETRASLLISQKSEHFPRILNLVTHYHHARDSAGYKEVDGRSFQVSLPAFKSENCRSFYDENGYPAQWRKIYNVYCRYFYVFMKESDFTDLSKPHDERYVKVIQEDLTPCGYKHPGSSFPTGPVS